MTTNFWLIAGTMTCLATVGCTADMPDSITGPPGEAGPEGARGEIGQPAPAPTDEAIRGAVGLEILQIDDARLAYTPGALTCNPGEWCHALDSWSINRLAEHGRFTDCQGEADCSGNTVELVLDGNTHRSALLSHWDSPESRVITVELSFDGGSTYTFHKAINTHRVRVEEPKTSRIHTIASNLPLGPDIRIRLVAAKGRMNVEGFALSKLIIPESDTKPFRSIARASANGPVDDTCDVNTQCGPLALDARQVTFVKTQDNTDVRVHYIDAMRSHSLGGGRSGCRWHIRFNGSACPGGDIFGGVYADDTSLTNPHRTRSVGGYCPGLAAGTYTVQVYVSNVPGIDAQCATGFFSQRWLLEAEEVQ